jgi:hypothetical protein
VKVTGIKPVKLPVSWKGKTDFGAIPGNGNIFRKRQGSRQAVPEPEKKESVKNQKRDEPEQVNLEIGYAHEINAEL